MASGRTALRLRPQELPVMFYDCLEFKTFLDQRKAPEVSENRAFCGVCMKPRRMLGDDDLSDIFARSDFCRCGRRRRT